MSYHLGLRTAIISAAVFNYVYLYALASMVVESRIVDKILASYSGQADAEQVKDVILDILRYVGFHIFMDENSVERCDLPIEVGANICYTDDLSTDNRNPLYMLKQLEQV